MKKYRNHIIIGAAVLAVLALVFWWGGNAPGLRGWNPQSEPVVTSDVSASPSPSQTADVTPEPEQTEQPTAATTEKPTTAPEVKKPNEPATAENKPVGKGNKPMSAEEKVEMADQIAGESSPGVEGGDKNYSKLQGMEINASTGKDQYQTDPVPEGKPVPVEPQNAVITDKEQTCTLSVRCDTILQNMAWLDPEKVELVPKDGVIFAEQTVTFYEGESVFNLLVREMKKNKIHLEFVNTPIYNSAYIEGIHNLYEFDCGELSGWMYKVNGWFPNYGCSRYALKPGDKVEWVYTCDLGVDVGGHYAAAGD